MAASSLICSLSSKSAQTSMTAASTLMMTLRRVTSWTKRKFKIGHRVDTDA